MHPNGKQHTNLQRHYRRQAFRRLVSVSLGFCDTIWIQSVHALEDFKKELGIVTPTALQAHRDT